MNELEALRGFLEGCGHLLEKASLQRRLLEAFLELDPKATGWFHAVQVPSLGVTLSLDNLSLGGQELIVWTGEKVQLFGRSADLTLERCHVQGWVSLPWWKRWGELLRACLKTLPGIQASLEGVARTIRDMPQGWGFGRCCASEPVWTWHKGKGKARFQPLANRLVMADLAPTVVADQRARALHSRHREEAIPLAGGWRLLPGQEGSWILESPGGQRMESWTARRSQGEIPSDKELAAGLGLRTEELLQGLLLGDLEARVALERLAR